MRSVVSECLVELIFNFRQIYMHHHRQHISTTPTPSSAPTSKFVVPIFLCFPFQFYADQFLLLKILPLDNVREWRPCQVSNGRKKEANAIKTYKMGNYLLEWTVCTVFPRHQCDWQWIFFKSKDLPALTLVGPTRQKHHTAPPRCTKPPQPTRFDSFNIIASGGLYSVILHHN